METELQKAMTAVISPSQIAMVGEKPQETSLTSLQMSLKNSLTASRLVSNWSGTAAQMKCTLPLHEVVKHEGIPTLGDVSRVYGNVTVLAVISEHLRSVFRYAGIDLDLETDGLMKAVIAETSLSIATGYYYLNLYELCIFFNELKAGRRGQFVWGSKVNNQAIMVALHDFASDRLEAIRKLDMERVKQESGKSYIRIKGCRRCNGERN